MVIISVMGFGALVGKQAGRGWVVLGNWFTTDGLGRSKNLGLDVARAGLSRRINRA